MTAFIIIFIITILSTMYVDKLVKYKFQSEKNSIWKVIHVVAYLTLFTPLLVVVFLVSDENLIERGLLFMTILFYLGYKMSKKFNV